MGRPRGPITPKDIIGATLSENILELLPIAFPRAKTQTEQLKALEARCGVAKETIRRIINGDVSPRLNNLDAIARGLGVTAAGIISTTTERLGMIDKQKRLPPPADLQRDSG